jgi:EmrB/QacA subfamily drug resistance transporter
MTLRTRRHETQAAVPTLTHSAATLPSEATRDGLEHANKWAVLALAATSGFMTSLDSSIVNISLPSIARTFGVPLNGSVEWVIIGYLLIIAATLLTFGRLADMIGRKPLLIGGLALFTFGSAICGLAPSLGLLVAARFVQGLGAALIFAVNIAMITTAFPAKERGRALGTNAIMVALGVSLGPTIGGIITSHLTWRWIFYVNVPIGVVTLVVAWFILTETLRRSNSRFDPAGAALLAVGLTGLILALSFGQEWGWASWRVIGALIVGIGFLAGALILEQRVSDPILHLALLRNRVFAAAEASFMFCMLALFAVGFLLPFYFEELKGFSPEQAGLMLTPMSLALAVVAPISGTLADRFRLSWLAPLGLGLACLGLVLLGQLTVQSSPFDVIWRLLVTGIGQGLFQSPNTSMLMGAAPAKAQGEASGILATGRVVAQGFSVALAGAIFAASGAAAAGALLATHRHTLSPDQVQTLQRTFTQGLHAALLACAAFAAIGIVTSLVRNAAGRPSSVSTLAAPSARQRPNRSATPAQTGQTQ